MDANYFIDEHLSTVRMTLNDLPILQEKVFKRLQFNQTSQVDIEMWAEYE